MVSESLKCKTFLKESVYIYFHLQAITLTRVKELNT